MTDFTESVQTKQRKRRTTITRENTMLAAVAVDPHVYSQIRSGNSGITKTSFLILDPHKFHPYHILHQKFHEVDFQNSVIFCEWTHD